jgi:hypothetical protein
MREVGKVKDPHFKNHLYGIFSSGAKERIVWVGRAQSAASYCPMPSSLNKKKSHKKRPNKKKKRKSQKKGQQLDSSGAMASFI